MTRPSPLRPARSSALGPVLAAALVAMTLGLLPKDAEAQHRNRVGFINFGFGPSVYLDGGGTQIFFVLTGALGVARDLSLLFQPSVAVGRGFTVVTLPLGIEYDAPIRTVPHLYVYPRLNMGAALFMNNGFTQGYFNIEPAFGVKYEIGGVWNIGFEPLAFPIYIGDNTTSAYRFTVFTGLIF